MVYAPVRWVGAMQQKHTGVVPLKPSLWAYHQAPTPMLAMNYCSIWFAFVPHETALSDARVTHIHLELIFRRRFFLLKTPQTSRTQRSAPTGCCQCRRSGWQRDSEEFYGKETCEFLYSAYRCTFSHGHPRSVSRIVPPK